MNNYYFNTPGTTEYLDAHPGQDNPDPCGCIWQTILILLFLIMLAVCCSCRSHKQVEKEYIHVHDTITQTINQRDSIWLHDSIYQEVIRKADTVYLYKYKQKTEYRDRWHHDSIYIAKTDTLYRDVVKEKQLTWWQRTRLNIGGWALLLLAGIALYYAAKFTISRFWRV